MLTKKRWAAHFGLACATWGSAVCGALRLRITLQVLDKVLAPLNQTSSSLLDCGQPLFLRSQAAALNTAGMNEGDGLLSPNINKSQCGNTVSLVDRVRSLFYIVRKLSYIILFWNLIFTVLMILVFPA